MPVKKEREYRTLVAPLVAQSSGEKRIQSECYVEGYATTFNAPYLLYEFEDGTKIYERIDAHALDSADMSDVIMQYDHEGRVFARACMGVAGRAYYKSRTRHKRRLPRKRSVGLGQEKPTEYRREILRGW